MPSLPNVDITPFLMNEQEQEQEIFLHIFLVFT